MSLYICLFILGAQPAKGNTVFTILCFVLFSCTPGIPYIIGLSSFQVKKHIKQGEGHTGGIFSIEAPLHVSNVQVVDPVTGYVI
jgi:hypothetical protein